MIERAAQGLDAASRDLAVAGLEADYAAECRRQAHGTEIVGAERQGQHAARDRRRGSAGRTARYAVPRPGVTRRPKGGLSEVTPSAALVHVQHRDRNQSGGAQPPHADGVCLRDPVAEGGRSPACHGRPATAMFALTPKAMPSRRERGVPRAPARGGRIGRVQERRSSRKAVAGAYEGVEPFDIREQPLEHGPRVCTSGGEVGGQRGGVG